ncbi:MAG: right-handed parallel beta-helix repeat-containing protein [Thermodesulfobacteriota bacterium]
MGNRRRRPAKTSRPIFITWVICFIILFGIRAAGGTNYYVSPQGSDSNNGFSLESPWQSIAKVNSFHFQPGDSILFECGGMWRETLKPIYSGTSGHPITYGSYGSGDRPIIEGTDIASSWNLYSDHIWYRNNYSYDVNIVLFDQNLGHEENSLNYLDYNQDWYWDSATQRVYIYCSDDPNDLYSKPGIEIGASRQNGVKIYDETESIKYLTFENLHFSHANDIGMELQGCSYITIDNCIVDTCGRINMYVYDIKYLTINDSQSFGCLQQHGLYISAGNYIKPQGDQSHHITISNSDFYYNKQNGIQINPNNGPAINYFTLTRCELYKNGGHGILDEGTYNGLYSYNYFYDNAGAQVFCHYNEVHHPKGDVAAKNTKIYNNIIGSINTTSQFGLYISDYSYNCVVKNNIFYWENGVQEVVRVDQRAPKVTFDYNCYYVPNPTNKFKWGNKWYSSFSSWRSASKKDKHSFGSNPQFSNVYLYDFALLSTSPCIDAGVNVGQTQDHEGNPVPYGLAPDIGALEYSG